ncbi:MAG: hypothetical protein WCW33_00885 [Candidatus Babeliales bacterium]|jgi:hypothetical protein
MKHILTLLGFFLLTLNTAQPIKVGGMYLTAEEEPAARREWLKSYPNGSKLLLNMGLDNEYHLAAIKEPGTTLYYLGLQKEPYDITIKHDEGSDFITFELPQLKDSDAWAIGPWKVVPQHGSLGPRLLLWHEEKGGFLCADQTFSQLFITKGDVRSGNVSFWYYGSKRAEPSAETTPAAPATPLKEYVFKELSNGTKVTIWSNQNKSYITYKRVPAPMFGKSGRPMPTLIQPTKAIIETSPTPQIYEIQINELGVFFMPPGKPGTRSVPGFGPYKVVPVDPKNPNLQQIYLQNASEPTKYVNVDSNGTVIANATEPTSLAIRLNKFSSWIQW